jgi:general secretion pathway protein D
VAPDAPAADREPPGAAGPLPNSMDAIAKATDVPFKPQPPGRMVKFNLQDADLGELVNHISGMTGRRFIYGPKVRQIKATVISPEPVSLAEAYQAFLSILEANGMTVIPQGRFLKIVDSGGVITLPTPVYSRGAPVPEADRYVTRLYRLKYVGATEVMNVLNKFKSKEADITAYDPGQLLIITDTGTNVRRLIRIVEELDVGGVGQQMWIEPVNNGSADEMAKRIADLFGLNAPAAPPGSPGAAAGNASGLTRVLAEEQTNSLIIVGTEDAYLRLLELLKRIDIKPTEAGKVRVLPLQHANAEELSNTLTQMLTSATAKGAPGDTGVGKGMFEGDVKVTADKPTNSLIITSSGRDYATLRLVIAELDMPRRQVFIEAVIMDLSVSDSTRLGTSWHAGYNANIGGGGDTILASGLKAQDSIAFPVNQDLLQGFAVGARGPDLPGTSSLTDTGLSIPAFGVVLHALTSSGKSNVLATPHIIATDNTAAEINIGENIPLQDNIGGGLSNLASLGGSATGGSNPLAALGALGAYSYGFSAPRQDVGNKIKVTPHINDSNQVRLEINQESSARGASSGSLGAVTIVKRTAQTTVTVDDQQTVVIGGLMRDEVVSQQEKIPLLGDIPLLGFLFRHQTNEKRKANLLLILTPYIIRDQTDLRKIFERKMQERQEFLDRYFVFSGSDWSPPRDYSRANGLVEDIRQAYFKYEERVRLQRESMPEARAEHEPSKAIELPADVAHGPATSVRSSKPASAAPAKKNAPTKKKSPARRKPRSELDSPVRINPIARSVNVERVE